MVALGKPISCFAFDNGPLEHWRIRSSFQIDSPNNHPLIFFDEWQLPVMKFQIVNWQQTVEGAIQQSLFSRNDVIVSQRIRQFCFELLFGFF